MGFPTTPKSAPQLDPFPPFGDQKHEKNAKNGFYHFQMIKLCGEAFPIKTSSGKVVCTNIWKTSVKKFSKSVHSYTFYTDFSAPPRLTQMRYFQTAVFPKRLHRFGCAIYRWKGYDILYVVAKFYWEGVPSSRLKYRSNVRKQRFRLQLCMQSRSFAYI